MTHIMNREEAHQLVTATEEYQLIQTWITPTSTKPCLLVTYFADAVDAVVATQGRARWLFPYIMNNRITQYLFEPILVKSNYNRAKMELAFSKKLATLKELLNSLSHQQTNKKIYEILLQELSDFAIICMLVLKTAGMDGVVHSDEKKTWQLRAFAEKMVAGPTPSAKSLRPLINAIKALSAFD